MIRFVKIGDQVNEGENEFCFYDTVRDKFVDFEGEQLFESVDDFDWWKGHDLHERCRSLISKEFFK